MELRSQSKIAYFPSYVIRGNPGETQTTSYWKGVNPPIERHNSSNGYTGVKLSQISASSIETHMIPDITLIRARLRLPLPITTGMIASAAIICLGVATSTFTLSLSGVGLLLTAFTALWEINAK